MTNRVWDQVVFFDAARMRNFWQTWIKKADMEKLLPNRTIRVSVQTAAAVALFGFGLVSGLYLARLDIGKTVAEQGRQIDVNTSHLHSIDDNLTRLNALAHSPDAQVSEAQHAELLKRIEDNQILVMHAISMLDHNLGVHMENTQQQLNSMNGRIDNLERLMTLHFPNGRSGP